MKKKPVWLDCDPGHDDCFAIALAAYHQKLNLLGISTTGGNQSVEKTTSNALSWLSHIGKSTIPVYRGEANPLVLKPQICAEIHGESGLESFSSSQEHLATALKPQKQGAVSAMAETILRSAEPVTLIGIARLTNIALMLQRFPDVTQNIEQIVLMGGALGVGNTQPVSEFNIESDPHAAEIVFNGASQDYKLVMIPLEVTHRVLVTPDIFRRVRSLGEFGLLCEDLLLFFKDPYEPVFGFPPPPLHDPCAVYYVTNPEQFTTRLVNVEIETSSPLSLGQTVADMYSRTDRTPNVIVGTDINTERFWETMLEALKAVTRASDAGE
ncbi:MAG: nucleoside hydrolase [Candidatus Marinimicrobia bacterium]|nr:nucleoside hydrolase [Candidatus Neomarinimicrobiota bacterium]